MSAAGHDERPWFTVGVVGPKLDGREADRLAAWLDAVVASRRAGHKIGLVSLPGGPARAWALARNVQTILAGQPSAARAEFELLAWADALVVVGDPDPWSRLVRLAGEGGVPVRHFRT